MNGKSAYMYNCFMGLMSVVMRTNKQKSELSKTAIRSVFNQFQVNYSSELL